MLKKHITINNTQTTIALEPIFWDAISRQFAGSVNEWVTDCIRDKPDQVTRASWIRQRVVNELINTISLKA
ncbi:MAG: ribbon-helix-helix domain-containing protein [Candidatus Thioglobus sp.]|nr:ribbon-helix-helix domain-containing protein [Candidatus Thioglobus sp.]